MNEAVGMKNHFTMDGRGKRVVCRFSRKDFGNALVLFYWQLPMGRKGTNSGEKYQNILVRWHPLNYEDMSVETLIYIRYVVLTIVVFTSMLAIELFYPTQLCSFLGCLF